MMQRLARHSTVELTIGRYTHANLTDLSDAVARMPDILVAPLVALAVAETGATAPQTPLAEKNRTTEGHGQMVAPEMQKPLQLQGFLFDREPIGLTTHAERQGFEPWVPFPVLWFSKPARSATLSPLRSLGAG